MNKIFKKTRIKSKQKQQITSAHIGCLCKVRGGCISKERYGNLKLHNCRPF